MEGRKSEKKLTTGITSSLIVTGVFLSSIVRARSAVLLLL